jgi:multidrug efflux pump subunit AcrA (membrane-fusion protein)
VALFARSLNMANEGEAANMAPMSGGTFDFKKMVCQLLGIPEDQSSSEMVNERFKEAMNCDMGDDLKKQKANEADLADAQSKLLAANGELTKTTTTLAQEQEAKTKAEAQATLTATQLLAANERVTKAEAAAANARQNLRKFIGAALIKEGRLTRAQWGKEEAELSKPEFANAEQFDARVNELSKRESTFGVTSSIIAMLADLGEMSANKGNAQTAANEVGKMVSAEMTANPKLSYDDAWANVKRTEKGKGLMEQMKQPQSQVN